MKTILSTSLLLFSVFGEETSETSQEPKTLPNSCIDQEDGLQWLKPLGRDDYPIISAKCSNGYTMIDYNVDSDWSNYFTSFLKWHYEIGGPNQQQHINWQEWYIPGNDNTNFIISPDCDSCSEELQSSLRNSNGLQSGYYMNANLFGCFVYPRGMPACDFDLGTYECHACITDVSFDLIVQTDFDDPAATDQGACMTWIRGSNDEVDRTFDDCTDQSESGWKPTIGMSGRFCVCTKPDNLEYYEITPEQIDAKKESLKAQNELRQEELLQKAIDEKATAKDNTFYITKESFSKGTYRIQKAGTYILQEDVEFDWNAGTDKSNPNAKDAWWPNENDEDYPGWGTTRDPYFMGFFAGITIETDNVVLDLNGHELKQSKAFFYQQGFFSVIEVESQPFMPGQGVGFFGSDPQFPNNVVIKNGIIGRTSHHCIHGNYNENLLIENIKCYDFSTHGIQLNGFDNVVIRNVEIGPSNNEQYLASEYTHYRFILERMRRISEENPTGTIKFVNRDEPVTMGDLTDELELKMNLAFKYVMYGEEYFEGDELYEDYIDAKKIFISEHGYGYGASQYGLFLSYPGANVLTYHINDKISNHVIVENVHIHDITHKTKEYVGIRTTLRLFVNSFNAPLHLEYLLGDELWKDLTESDYGREWNNDWQYSGNILTDSTIAMSQLTDNWGYLQIMYLLSYELTAWAKGEYSEMNAEILCAVDGMIHAAKGAFGLRIDGVSDVTLDNVRVDNIFELSNKGYDMCGECTECAFEAKTPYQVGYAGNMAQGICVDYSTPINFHNVKINNIESKTGRSFGIALWPGVEAEFSGDIFVSNIIAGEEMELGKYTYASRPNRAPEACGIRVYDSEWGYDENDSDNAKSRVYYNSQANMQVSCVTGHVGCWDKGVITQHGSSYDCEGNLLSETSDETIQEKLVSTTNDIDMNINNIVELSYLRLYYFLAGIAIIAFSLIIFYTTFSCLKNKQSKNNETNSEYSPLI